MKLKYLCVLHSLGIYKLYNPYFSRVSRTKVNESLSNPFPLFSTISYRNCTSFYSGNGIKIFCGKQTYQSYLLRTVYYGPLYVYRVHPVHFRICLYIMHKCIKIHDLIRISLVNEPSPRLPSLTPLSADNNLTGIFTIFFPPNILLHIPSGTSLTLVLEETASKFSPGTILSSEGEPEKRT